jgi:hypothetical protein
MAQYTVVAYLHDESGETWSGHATSKADALVKAIEYFDDSETGSLTDLTGTERNPTNTGPLAPEEIPAEGNYLYEITMNSARPQA